MTSIVERFDRLAAERRDEEAIDSRAEGLHLSFGQVRERVLSWQEFLCPETDAPLALAVGNCSAFVELFLAARRLGLPVLLMDAGLALRDKLALCRRLGVRALLHRDGGGELLAEGVELSRLQGVRTQPLHPGTALIKLTSGSTGEPLGACFDEAALLVGIEQIAKGMEIGARDRVLIPIPLSHSYGFDNGVLSFAVVGTPLLIENSIFPAPLSRAVAERGATVLPLVPPLVHSLGQAQWPRVPTLRRALCAGGLLRPEAAQCFYRATGVPVHNFYGSTETGGVAFESQPLAAQTPGTVGRPLPGVKVELDRDGRVWVSSSANLLGYLGQAEQRGPVLMGDTATWADDGRLCLTGRTADFLDIGGKKVSAAAMEEALRGVSGVREAAVVGVADPVRGDRAVAFVVSDGWPLELGCMPRSLAPRELRRLESLPYTERGKLDRCRLRQLLMEPETGRGGAGKAQ